MNLTAPFIRRPVATTLLSLAVLLAGALAFRLLPVSPLPQVDFPTIQVSAALPGASPETMASAVATPLERQFSRIAGVTEMTSSSSLGTTSITLQFELSRDVDAAGRDVQAAINAARGQLPANLPNNPTYRKVNPADAPILILALTSDTVDTAGMYDAASSVLQQKVSQVDGVGQVTVGGSSLPAVRVELNPDALSAYGVGLDDIRNSLAAANANVPKGELAGPEASWQLSTTDQLHKAEKYRPLIAAWRNGAPVRVSDVANVSDSVEDVLTAGLANGQPAVSLVIFRAPNANIIDTVDRVRGILPELQASISPAIKLAVMVDRTTTIRASIADVERTLVISVLLVIAVVFVFLRNARVTLVPSIALPLSLVGTFAAMYLLGYSLDNLSLMALTVSTGFVVDDAIVVVENVTRYLEKGMTAAEAALRGSAEVAFTVMSMSISLIAVFIPILLMQGMVGRLFREFAVTLAIAITFSMIVSLTTTPSLCAAYLRAGSQHGRLYMAAERVFQRALDAYSSALAVTLQHKVLTLLILTLTIGFNVYLFASIPKGFFPQQDTGRLVGSFMSTPGTSFQWMRQQLSQCVSGVMADPAVENVVAFAGGGAGTTNTARMFVQLKSIDQRGVGIDQVMARLRQKLSNVAGASVYLQPVQDIRIGGRISGAQYQYTLHSDDLDQLSNWGDRILTAMRSLPQLTDVNSDQQNQGLEASVAIDRDSASRLGVTPQAIDNALYDAFGQRQVSTIYTPLNQYHVVMTVAPQYWQDPEALKKIYVRSSSGALVPLSAFARYTRTGAPLVVNHQGLSPAVTVSFNLAPGVALSDAIQSIHAAEDSAGMPAAVRGTFEGTAQEFQASLRNEPALIAAAVIAVFVVLGILYESYIHPITILSTLPSAGIGALLALNLFHSEFDVIALIGIILLIGIVKKNAIMMIDFALQAERTGGKSPEDAIYEACRLRFRPIMMTTLAALLGALPLALGTGTGSELRRPLGIAIVGGLMVSQMLTLFTTPVVYLCVDKLRHAFRRAPQQLPSEAV